MKFNLSALRTNPMSVKMQETFSYGFIHPLREWSFGLGFAILLFVCCITYISYDFYAQSILSEEVTLPDEKVTQYHETEVEEYANKYTEQKKHFEQLRSEIKVVAPVVVEEESTPVLPEGTLQDEPLAEDTGDEYTTSVMSI